MSVTTGGEMVIGLSLNDQLSAGLRAAADNVIAFGGSVERSLAALGRLGPAAAGMAGISIAMKAGVSAAADLEQRVANLNAVLSATPAQMKQVMQASLDLSRQSQFTASQIIAAQTQIAKAGSNPQQVIGQTKNVLDLASATFSDPTQAANAYVSAMKVFQVANSDSKATVDDLAKAVDSSVGSLADFQTAYKQIGPVAHSANLSLHDTNVAITDLMNSGLRGDTGTALKTFLQRIQHETPQARAEVEKLGLSFYDQSGQLKALGDIADQVRQKTLGMTDEQKNFSLTQIFGARGVRVADIFAEEGSAGFADVEQHMASIGDASEIAAKKLDTLQGQAHILGSSLNILAVQGGNTVLPMLKGVAQGATEATNALSRLPQIAPQLALGGGALAAEAFFMRGQQTRRDAPARAQYAREQAEYEASVRAATAKDVSLQEGIRNAQIKGDAFSASVGSTDLAGEKRITNLEEELALLRTKGDLEASIFRQEEEAAAAGTARLSATMTALAEQQAITERQMQQRLLTRGPLSYDASLAGNLKQSTQKQTFLQNGGDIVGLEAYQRDLTAYENKLAEINKQAAAAGLKNVHPKLPEPQLNDYMPQTFAARALHDVERDAAATPNMLAVPIKPEFLVDEELATTTLKGKMASTVGKAAKGLASLAMPALITLTLKELIIDPILDSITKKWVEKTLGKPLDLTLFPTDEGQSKAQTDRSKDGLNQRIVEQSAIIKKAQDEIDSESTNFFKKWWGRATDPKAGQQFEADKSLVKQGQANIAEAKQQLAQIDALAKTGPGKVLETERTRLEDVAGQVSRGKLSVDQALNQLRTTEDPKADPYGDRTVITDDYLAREGVAKKDILSLDEQTVETIKAAGKEYQDNLDTIEATKQALRDTFDEGLQKAHAHQDMGVPDETIARADFGYTNAGIKATKAQIADANKEVAAFEQAWKKAETAIGGVDASKGIPGLVTSADALRKAVSALSQLGTGDANLTALSGIASQFKDIQDAEDKASASFNGYMLTINESDRRISQLTSIQKGFEAALEAAEKRQARGTASPDDLSLIKNAHNIEGNLSQDIDHIQQHTSGDWLGIAKNLPDMEKLDNMTRDVVANTGGNKETYLKIKDNTDEVKAAIDKIVNGPHETTLTVHVAYDYPPLRDGTIYPGGHSPYDDPIAAGAGLPPGGGASGSKQSFPGPADSSGNYPGTPFTGIGGATSTPNGDASRVLSYKEMISLAAKQYGVPEWLIAAIIMHESSGTPGIANQQGSGAVGLMQVMPSGPGWDRGYTPADMSQLRGTSQSAENYQIQQGTKILRDFLDANHGDYTKALEGYGGDPSYYKTLLDQYQRPVQNALYGGQGQSTVNGPGAGAGGVLPGYGPGDRGLGSGQDPTGGALGGQGQGNGINISSILAAARKHLNEMTQIDGEPWYLWCEKFVGNAVQDATGVNYRPKTADQHIRDAMAGVPGAGRIIDAKDALPGDLVGWLGTSPYAGNPAGHIGINEGGNNYIGTTAKGIQERPIGPDAIFIRPDGVVANGPEPGSVLAKAPASSSSRAAQGYGPGTYTSTGGADAGTKDATQDVASLEPILAKVGPELADIRDQFKHMDASDVAETTKQFQTLEPILERMAVTSATRAKGAPLNPFETSQAQNAGLQQGLDIELLIGKATEAQRNKSAELPKIYDEIRQKAGPIGENLVQQLSIYDDQQQILERINALTARKAELEEQHTALMTQRAAEDRAEARSQATLQNSRQDTDTLRQRNETKYQNATADGRLKITRAEEDAAFQRQQSERAYQRQVSDTQLAIQRGWEDDAYQRQVSQRSRTLDHQQEMRGIQDATNAENDSYRVISRNQQDKTRYLDFYGSEQKRILSDALFDQQEAFTKNRNSENAQSLLLTSSARGATTNAGALSFAAQNASLKNRMATEDDNLTKAEADNKHLQMLEDRKHAQEMYDLETETIAQTRAHEDELERLGRLSTQKDRDFQDESDRIAAEDMLRSRSQALEQRGWQDVATAHSRAFEDMDATISRSQTLEQRGWADIDTAHQRSFDAESNRITDLRTQQDRAHQQSLYNIEDRRTQEDAMYTAAITSIDKEIAAQQALSKEDDARMASAQDALKIWDQVSDRIDGAGSAILDAFTNIAHGAGSAIADAANAAYKANQADYTSKSAGLTTANGVPYSDFPLPDASHYAKGGKITGKYAIVGDGPNGEILSTTELISAPGYNVTNGDSLAALFASPASTAPITIIINQQPGEDAVALAAEVARILGPRIGTADIATRAAAKGARR